MLGSQIINNVADIGGGIYAEGNTYSVNNMMVSIIQNNSAVNFGSDKVAVPVKMKAYYNGAYYESGQLVISDHVSKKNYTNFTILLISEEGEVIKSFD